MACEGCIEATTPSLAKRGWSCGVTTWACSMRQRGSDDLVRCPTGARSSFLEPVQRLAVAAVADGVDGDLGAALQRLGEGALCDVMLEHGQAAAAGASA